MQVRGVMSMVVCVVASLGIAPSDQQSSPRSASVLVGDARITTSADGLTAVVSIDLDGDGDGVDGVVDQAFRIQLPAPASLAYAGPATLVHTANQLSIGTTSSGGWTILVAGSAHASKTGGRELLEAVGLAHFWGSATRGSHDDVAARLLSTACPSSPLQAQSGESCSDCTSGGPGSTECSVNCNGSGGCSVSCSDAAFACCTCGGCRCCR